MSNLFIEFLPKRPEHHHLTVLSLSELPTGIKRMLRIQAKTFVDYIEDADRSITRNTTVRFLERCLTVHRKESDLSRGDN